MAFFSFVPVAAHNAWLKFELLHSLGLMLLATLAVTVGAWAVGVPNIVAYVGAPYGQISVGVLLVQDLVVVVDEVPAVIAPLRAEGVTARRFRVVLFGAVLALVGALVPAHAQEPDSATLERADPPTEKEAPYVPTPQHMVRRMLELADVGEDDIVYDLGSGDGRIVIMAAKEFGARGVGVEIDRDLVKRARFKARQAGVSDRVEFRQGDLFEAEIDEATVVALYLWPHMNARLRPKLQSELTSGARVVSYDFGINGWEADTVATFGSNTLQERRNQIYLWTVAP